MTVSTYSLKAANGRHIRKATMVTLADGSVVKFMDKMSNSEAIRQVRQQKALKCYWEVRDHSGDGVTSHEAILCLAHRDRLFSAMPNSRGNNEWFPAEQCDLCTGKKHYTGGFKFEVSGEKIAL